MTADLTAPADHDLPPGRLEARTTHLLKEIAETHQPIGSRWRRVGSPRFVLVAAAGLGVAAAAAVLSLSTGTSGSNQPAVGSAISGQSWSTAVVFGKAKTTHLEALTLPTSRVNATVTGGTAMQRRLLRTIVSGVQPTAITAATLSSRGHTVSLSLVSKDRSPITLWQKALIAAAFRDRLKIAGLPTRIVFNSAESHGVISSGPAVTVPAATPGAAATARRRFELAARLSDTRLKDLRIYRPDGVAIAATLVTDNPARFLQHQLTSFLTAIGDRWTGNDGVFLTVLDSSASPVFASSTVSRTSTGSIIVRKDLAGCAPFAGWGPTPPRCPTK
jgi:hypothetical protein